MKSLQMTPELNQYLVQHTRLSHPILEKVQRETAIHPYARMQISPEQGAFMAFLARLIGAKRYVEVGCFTGYSAIAVASAMPPGSQVIALDKNPETSRIASAYIDEAGLTKRITIRLGDGQSSLATLIEEFGQDSFDMSFIDADKTGIPGYFEQCLRLVRPGGLILVDNVLWSGQVADPSNNSPDTRTLKKFNDDVHLDPRVDTALLNIADGLYTLRKRHPNDI